MRLSVLSGAALLADGFFVLGRPLSTRQVAGDWNQITPAPSGSDWIGSLPKLSTEPDTFGGFRIADANLDTPPTDPALSGGQTNGIGDIFRLPGSSSNPDSFSPLPEFKPEQVATNQDFGNFPINTVTDMSSIDSITESPNEIADASVMSFAEFDNAGNIYCFYPWSPQTQNLELSTSRLDNTQTPDRPGQTPDAYTYAGMLECGHSQNWEHFSLNFVQAKPGYVIYKDAKNNYYSIMNLVKSQCQKLNGEWHCDDSTSKSISSARQSWMTNVRLHFGTSVPSLGPIHSYTELQEIKGQFSLTP